MSENPARGATTIRPSKGDPANDDKGGGGGGRLLLGAVAALVLIGGGYFAWKTYGTTQSSAQAALNDTYSSSSYADDPLRGPTETGGDTVADPASADSGAAATATDEVRSPRSTRSATASANAVPEETIGITPISATASEAATSGDDIVVTASRRPIWVRTPSARRLSALYPERALARGREGEARLHCTVRGNGALDCARMEETPGGFGPAAIRVASTLRHAPRLADGRDATGSPVNLRVVFRLDDETRRG